MKKKVLAMILCGILAVTAAAPAFAAETSGSTSQTVEQTESIPDSVLYYGEVKEVFKDKDGNVSGLLMDSERYGEYIFNISKETFWIDSGKEKAAKSRNVRKGDRLYVFHSPASTRSLPPQSVSYTVVDNVPMDVGSAQYYEVETVTEKDGKTWIETNNGGLLLTADEKTKFSAYDSNKKVSADDLRVGGHIMAWTGVTAASNPAQTPGLHIMLLPETSREPLTKELLAQMLYDAEGSPYVRMNGKYEDILEDTTYQKAACWAVDAGVMEWEGGSFQPRQIVTREELVTALWKVQGSPRLMGYTGLSKADDVGEIARNDQPAWAWAHQKGLFSGTHLGPKDPVTIGDAENMLRVLEESK